ncbi:cytidylyltransferase domain-containing protein [Brevibacillus sp. SYSU BS000544]|uniref:acylneuraminate cytidylyltransferase family protein n=1 Tax=Brevibacillus sp. SYSU BS000544 TaxID=3416443 RepID=UPI003CE57985
MIQDKKVLAIIPARGGSKGVPRKNIRELCGKPLIAWTIEEAKKSKYIDRLILSSDDQEIIAVSREWGCDVPFVRPKELALDTTPGIEPVLHALELLPGFDYVVLLQPTSPLRIVEDIDLAIECCADSIEGYCVSVVKQDKSPYWMYELDQVNRMKKTIQLDDKINTTRRQNLPDVFSLNGAVYVAKVEKIKESGSFLTEHTIAYVMPRERSFDLDEELDFYVAETILNKRIKKE